MTSKHILRILAALLLLGLFHFGPRFFAGEEAAGKARFSPHEADTVTIEGMGPLPVSFFRSPEGRWEMAGMRGVHGDRSALTRLLEGVATARLQPAFHLAEEDFGQTGIRVEILGQGRQLMVFSPGARRVPFQSQYVEKNGRIWEMGFDASAVLGIWKREHPVDREILLDKVLHAADHDPVLSLRMETPFADIQLDRATASAPWAETGAFRQRKVSQSSLELVEEALSLILMERLPLAAELNRHPLEAARVTFGRSSGQEVGFGLSGPLNRQGEILLWMLKPHISDPLVVSTRTAHGISLRAPRVFEGIPPMLPQAALAVAIRYERDGRRVELAREGRNWVMVRPRVPLPIFRPPPDEDNREPLDMAEELVRRLSGFLPDQLFLENTPERREMAVSALAEPLARLFVDMPGNRRSEILISTEIGATGHHLISVDRRLAVVTTDRMDLLAPRVEMFFQPDDFKGVVIQW